MGWTKESDWLPLSNAFAQVKFWKKDLEQAEDQLDYVESFKKYNLPGYDDMVQAALDDVTESQIGLAKSKGKLAKTLKRVNSGD